MTSVWPALWPPWKRTTMSACSDNQSTILPFPSSPHWAPTTTTLAISRVFPLQLTSFEHDLFEDRSPRDHVRGHAFCGSRAQPKSRPGPVACEAHHRIKDAGYRRKQEGGPNQPQRGFNPLISPENLWPRQGSAAATFGSRQFSGNYRPHGAVIARTCRGRYPSRRRATLPLNEKFRGVTASCARWSLACLPVLPAQHRFKRNRILT